MPQDVLEILESWLALMQQCPRHFRLSAGVLEGLATYALPAAGSGGAGWRLGGQLQSACDRTLRQCQDTLSAAHRPAPPAHPPRPPAVKRMSEAQLAQLAGLARDIALHRSDADMQPNGLARSAASARDLVQPLFALAAAEAAWRCSSPLRYVSPETVSALVTAGACVCLLRRRRGNRGCAGVGTMPAGAGSGGVPSCLPCPLRN